MPSQSASQSSAYIDVPCMRIQICDNATTGCGRIIEDVYGTPQICSYTRHPEFTPEPDRPWENAPYMRRAVVAEVVGLPMNYSVRNRNGD